MLHLFNGNCAEMIKMFIGSFILCIFVSLACAKVPPALNQQNGLVGGRDPKYGEVKYIVAIHSYKSFCGGAIIHERFILTAAHCIYVNEEKKQLLKPMRIIAGTNVAWGYNKANVIEVDVKKVFMPKPYVKGGSDDIAILELKTPLLLMKYHNKLQKLSLPEPSFEGSSRYSSYENELVKFAGYGNTRADKVVHNGMIIDIKRSGAGRLQVAAAVIDNNKKCEAYFQNVKTSEMCLSVIEDKTKQKEQGTCQGDSGSPAVFNNTVIVGLDSRGYYCDNNIAPTLFTRVSSYIPFIQQAMSGNSSGLVVYDA